MARSASKGASARTHRINRARPTRPVRLHPTTLLYAWFKTYGLPVIVSNCSNNYGPFQFPEKLIPLAILNALDGLPLSVYGDGSNVRDWLFVDDHVEGLLALIKHGRPGEKYNFGGSSERSNLAVVEQICDILDDLVPAKRAEAFVHRIRG